MPTKDGRIQSPGMIYQKNVKAVYEKFHDVIAETDTVPEEAMTEICKILSKHFYNTERSTFQSFCLSFHHGIDTHLKSVAEYQKAIRAEAQRRNCEHKLAFLIEVHTDYSNLFLHDEKGTRLATSSGFVTFTQVFKMLEALGRQADYVILCYGGSLFNEVHTIGLRGKHIRNDLQKQHIKSYCYCGHDLHLPPGESFVKDFQLSIPTTHDENGFNLHPEAEYKVMAPEIELEYMWTAARSALALKIAGVPFAVNLSVEMLIEIYGDYIDGWVKTPDNDWGYKPILRPEASQIDFDQEFSELCRRWGLTT